MLVIAAACAACATPDATDTGLRSSPAASGPERSLPPAAASASVAPPSPPPSPTPAALAAGEWSPIDLELKRGDRVTDVAALNHGFVAVGYNCTPDDFCDDPIALSWTSEDGSIWKRHRSDDLTDVAIMAVAAGPDGLVGVGNEWAGKRWRTAALASTDGVAWRATGRIRSVEPGEPPCYRDPAPGFCNASVVFGGGSILVEDPDFSLSTDGREWESFDVAGKTSPFLEPDGGYVIPRIVGTSDGYVGARILYDPLTNDVCLETGHAEFLISPDGRTWTKGLVSPEPDQGVGIDLAAFAAHETAGYTALGGTYPPCGEGRITPACWSSADGIHWATTQAGPTMAEALAPAANGFIAIEFRNERDAVWFSPGGCAWQRLEDMPDQLDSRMLVADDTHVVAIERYRPEGLVRTPFR